MSDLKIVRKHDGYWLVVSGVFIQAMIKLESKAPIVIRALEEASK